MQLYYKAAILNDQLYNSIQFEIKFTYTVYLDYKFKLTKPKLQIDMCRIGYKFKVQKMKNKIDFEIFDKICKS